MGLIWLVILSMAAITFFCRYVFFSSHLNFRLSEPVKQLLSYTAPAVLTAMWAPIVFNSEKNNGILFNWNDPFLLAGLITIALSCITKHTLVIVIIGFGTFISLSTTLL